jgi:ABC-2 type transport system permease protein
VLHALRHHARIYLKLIVLQQRAHLEYEADFWIMVVGATLRHVPGFVFVWVLFGRIPDVAGWTMWEIAFLYGLVTLPMGLREVLFDGMWRLRLVVNRGEFDRFLVRPISPAMQVVAQLSSVFGLGVAALGAYVVGRAAAELGLRWEPWQYAFLVVVVLSSVVLIASVDFATNSIAFWEPSANSAFPYLVHNTLELARFPVTLYGRLVQIAVTWVVPFAFVSYFPGSVLLGRPEANAWLGYGAPLAALAAFTAAALVWNRGLARYQGAGH